MQPIIVAVIITSRLSQLILHQNFDAVDQHASQLSDGHAYILEVMHTTASSDPVRGQPNHDFPHQNVSLTTYVF